MSAVSDRYPVVEFVEHNPRSILTGTGRYVRELYRHLTQLVPIRRTATIDPPMTRHLPMLHHFPVGIQGHRTGNIVHFTQPLGSSIMLWNPFRPSIATVHDLSWLAWPPEAGMFRKLERLILHLSYLSLKRLDAVITVSEYSRLTVIEHLKIPAERLFSVHSGNCPNQFKPVADARTKLANKYPFFQRTKNKYLLYVGNEFPRKNLETLLKALSVLPKEIWLLKVGSAGGRQFRARTRRLIAEFGLEDRVIFAGEVSEEELVLLYNAADLYICSSYLEGFCHPVLEAMACGLPVVGSQAASIPEITGNAAVLVSPSKAEGFAEAAETILGDRNLRDQMVADGLQRAAKYTWDLTAREVSNVYRWVARDLNGSDTGEHHRSHL